MQPNLLGSIIALFLMTPSPPRRLVFGLIDGPHQRLNGQAHSSRSRATSGDAKLASKYRHLQRLFESFYLGRNGTVLAKTAPTGPRRVWRGDEVGRLVLALLPS